VVQLLPTFPDVAWFQALADAMANHEDDYAQLGFADIAVAFRITGCPDGRDRQIGVRFVEDECSEVAEIEDDPFATFGADCMVTGPYEVWAEMVDNIVTNGAADARHTLNSLVMLRTPLEVDGPDQYGVDKFYRYQATIQRFFDEAGAPDFDLAAAGARGR